MLNYQILPVTPFMQNCTLLWCDETREAALVDPGGEEHRLLEAIAERGLSVWLRAELDVLVERTIGRRHRPLLNSGDPRATLAALMAARYPV